jgi:ATP-dependent Lhr-like helicase
MPALPAAVARWFQSRGWTLRGHQAAMLDAAARGQDALLLAATGAGKTLSGFLPLLCAAAAGPGRPGLKAIYVSPLKALASDIARNLEQPIADLGLALDVDTRTGDTPAERRRRQRTAPPDIVLTTPESLSLLLSYPDALAGLSTVGTLIVDEIHSFALTRRGDLLALASARLRALAPGLRRVGLSATVADPAGLAEWLAPEGGAEIIVGDAALPPHIHILTPDGTVPWRGHSGRHAAAEVLALIENHRQTIVFVNTRSIAERLFRDLWALNAGSVPIGLHHGSLDPEARRRTEAALAAGRLRAVVATSSLELGIDWGTVDLVIQMGAPKGAARLVQRIGRSNHRLDQPSKAVIVPGNRFEYLEACAACDAIAAGEVDGEPLRAGGLDVVAQHLVGTAAAGPFDADALHREIAATLPYRGLDRITFDRVLQFVATGGYALCSYDRFQRLKRGSDGLWHLAHPRLAAMHRLNAGVIVEAPLMHVRLARRSLGTIEEWFGSQLQPGDRFQFSGLTLEHVRTSDFAVECRLARGEPSIPTYGGARMPLSTHLAARVRGLLADTKRWPEMPGDIQEWLSLQQQHSVLPDADQLLVETFPYHGRHYVMVYGFAGRNVHQSLGMLMTLRMEARGFGPLGFIATDYALGIWALRPVADPAELLDASVAADELDRWIEATPFLKRAFRDVAIISGVVERQHPGRPKSARALAMSTDLIFDVLRRHEPDHLLVEAAWAEARTRLTDIPRLENLLGEANANLIIRHLDRVSPLALPVLLDIGAEGISGLAEEELLAELAGNIAPAGSVTTDGT